ncbi:MAG: metallophosphoesterase family protein [Chloroflexota bacterium]|nr:metallophosphoesterase family protein [Chloroflexota bacterium]
MKIVLLTDIHGNLPALTAALEVIRQEGYDLLIHTGDAIGIGPYPAESIDLLLQQPRLQLIRGNHESRFVQGLPPQRPPGMEKLKFNHRSWITAQLRAELRPFIAQWPFQVKYTVQGLRLSFLHYALTPTGDSFQPVVFQPTATALDELFAGVDADIICYGHHHPPSDLTGRARYFNPGSLGCAVEPVARFAVLTVTRDGTYQLEKRAVPYDKRLVVAELFKRQVPGWQFIAKAFFGVSLPG